LPVCASSSKRARFAIFPPVFAAIWFSVIPWRQWSRQSGGGKFGESGEDEFGFTHVIAEILGFEAFQIFVGLDADSAPFLMDEVGEDGVFIPCLMSCASNSP